MTRHPLGELLRLTYCTPAKRCLRPLSRHAPLISEVARRTAATLPRAREGSTKTGHGLDVPVAGIRSKLPDQLQALSTPTLYEHLLRRAAAGDVLGTRELVVHLVRERGEHPSTRLYDALILSNASPAMGSASQVATLLVEMEGHGIAPDASTCHYALKALSVHVDQLLRADTLDLMRRRWFTLTTEGQVYVAAAQLREGDLEGGLLGIAEIQSSQPMHLPSWLIEMAVDLLLEAGEVGRAMRLVVSYQRANPDAELSMAVYEELLDEASMLQHLEATVWVWNCQVVPEHLRPGSGVCMNVLSTAAQHGDSELAAQAFRRLGALGVVFSAPEYELMCRAYLKGPHPDLSAALTTLTIMAENGLKPPAACTRPLYAYLSKKPQLLSRALEIALQLRHDGRTVPLEILNTFLEVHASRADGSGALEVYRMLQAFQIDQVPGEMRVVFVNAETYDHLYTAIARGGSSGAFAAYEAAMSAWEDQRAIGIPLTAEHYGNLVWISERSGRSEGMEGLQNVAQQLEWWNATGEAPSLTMEAKA